MDKRTIAETLADRDYWLVFEDLTGFILYGWTYRHVASFRTPDGSYHEPLLNLTGNQRDILVSKIKGDKNG